MRTLPFAIACLGLAATAEAQVNQFIGTPPNATNFLDFDNPFVPSGPIASNDVAFTGAGITSVTLIQPWAAAGDLMTSASNVMGQGLVSQNTVMSIAGPGEPLDNPSAGGAFDVLLAAPCTEFSALFVDQVNMSYDITLYDQGGTNLIAGPDTFVYSGGFPNPPHYWTGPGAFDRIVIASTSGGGGWGLDNFAFDSGAPSCIGTNYECPATVPNSSTNNATICATGSNVAANNDVTLTTTGLPTLANSFGYFLNSQNQNLAGFNPPGSQGQLCVGPAGIGRYNGSVFNSAGTGEGSLVLDLTATPTPAGNVAIQAGETWYFTTWFRDTNPNPTSNFSDGVCITFQ